MKRITQFQDLKSNRVLKGIKDSLREDANREHRIKTYQYRASKNLPLFNPPVIVEDEYFGKLHR